MNRTKLGVWSLRELEDIFLSYLHNCVNLMNLKKIHSQMVRLSLDLSQSSFLVTKMVDLCYNYGDIEYANLLFKQVVEPNVFLFNAMIRAYSNNHKYGSAIAFYKQMLRHPQNGNPIFPNRFTFPFVLKSCAGLFLHSMGKQVHAHVFKFGPSSLCIVENALVDLYAKCGNLVDAHKVFEMITARDVISWNCILSGHVRIGQMRKARALFEEMPCKSIVSWTAMISGYTQIGCYSDALDIFRQMQTFGVEPDDVSILSVLPACAQTGALEIGKWVHIYADRKGFLRRTSVCNALIEMYLKCGSLDQGLRLFNHMVHRDVISWSTMIGGLANHGKAHEAIKLFQEMQAVKVEPNEVTFLGLLSACNHAGLLSEGLEYFHSMREDYHIEPEIEHYGCLVDLLGRSGCIDQALDMIGKMPMEPDSKIWGSLLRSCRTHCNLDKAVIAMDHLIELEPDVTGNYVTLANIYANLGKWDNVSRIRKLMRSESMKRAPGCSMIEVDDMVQEFVSSDSSKPFMKDIFWMLELLTVHQNRTDDSMITEFED